MIVMKFGGTSVGTAASIRRVCEVIRKRLGRRPVVVVSALSGVTDALESAARAALRGTVSTAALRKRHGDVLRDLSLTHTLVEKELTELEELLRGVQLLGELSPRSLDYAMSFGERMSAKIVAAFLSRKGIPAHAFNAYDLGLVTDSEFGKARPLETAFDRIAEEVLSRPANEILIITGYIGKDAEGNITTLGRNGSDYSAAIIGSALGAEEIQIWTDVNGVMTADPTLILDARPIAEMSFDEAAEVAYYGAKVLHPATIQPAVTKNIPVRVLNTKAPAEPGTLIVGRARRSEGPVKAIVSKGGITVINIVSSRMLMQYGFLARIFDIFNRHRIVIDLVATSEVSVSCTTDSNAHLDEAVEELRGFSDVQVVSNRVIVAGVGNGIRHSKKVPARFFRAVADAGIGVEMISQGASRTNLSILVRAGDGSRAVRALHEAFFGSSDEGGGRPASARRRPSGRPSGVAFAEKRVKSS